ncbi:hypothetical protein EIP91_008251 [Steccherinum ochraceum]|uniref:F-box domain-containing protein n=1 Tax=Steccherinum ochraceum TaxID=92696 RepID=A0A4R0R339_9APHY|nr:hypothetical protein EIP91_008251 [Steccherinum ochraceum]
MSSCSTLYALGLPLLLANCVIRLNQSPSDHTISFVLMMLRYRHRPPFLRRLDLRCIPPSAPRPHEKDRTHNAAVSILLASVIASARNLTSIQLENTDVLLANSDSAPNSLFHAIASLSTLKTVDFSRTGPLGVHLLRRMTSPVVKVVLQYSMAYSTVDEADEVQLFPALSAFRDSLQELHVVEPLDFTLSAASNLQYPRVHTFTLTTESADSLTYLTSLPLLFPNLKNLILRIAHLPPPPYDLHYALSTLLHGQTWSSWSLDTLHCDVATAHAMALRCSVRKWTGVLLGRNEEDVSRLQTLLECFRPKQLSVAIDVYNFEHRSQEPFSEIFPTVGVTHLQVDLCGIRDTHRDSIGSLWWLSEVFDTLLIAFGRLSLEFLSIHIQADEDSCDWRERSRKVDDYLHLMNVTEAARRRVLEGVTWGRWTP